MIIYATIPRTCHYHYMQIDKAGSSWLERRKLWERSRVYDLQLPTWLDLGRKARVGKKIWKQSREEKRRSCWETMISCVRSRFDDLRRVWLGHRGKQAAKKESQGWRGKAPSCLCCSPPAHTAHRLNSAVCNVLHQLHFQQLSCPAVARHVTWSLHKLNCIAS